MQLNCRLLFLLLMLCALSGAAQAQQPFVTDSVDVTERKKFYFEFSNSFDLLQKSFFPSLKQNTASFEVYYGIIEGIEIGIELPLISIFNAKGASPKTVFGIGDANLFVKYNFLSEREGSRLPAMAITLAFELPTGDADKEIGSGIADYGITGIIQKTITERTKLRVNGGILYSGIILTDEIRLKARGLVGTAGASVIREFTPKLNLGVEITGSLASNSNLFKDQLQFIGGGNYALGKKITFDFGLVVGRFDGSPRVGLQLGVSVDF